MSVSLEDIRAAADRIAGVAVRTPLFEHPALNERAGARVLLKLENLQLTGSFKIRGAYNHIRARLDEIGPGGVLAWSSGNHAQAVARSARLLGLKAAIVMPADAPKTKVAGVRADGGEVIAYDRNTQSREEIGARIAAERGAIIVPPYDHPLTVAGQGVAGLEIVEDCASRDVRPEAVLVNCSGGGLIAGVSLVVKDAWPDAAVYSVEPEGFDDTARSLEAGTRVANAPGGVSICDALLAPTPGEVTFAINRRMLAGGLTASDDEARAAVRFAAQTLKLVIEPGGALALAAVLSGRFKGAGPLVAVVSGGNIDPAMLSEIIA